MAENKNVNTDEKEIEKKMNEKDFSGSEDQADLELSQNDVDVESDKDEIARGSRLGNVDKSYRDKDQPGV